VTLLGKVLPTQVDATVALYDITDEPMSEEDWLSTFGET
jgi:hypothetical protein